MKHKVFRMGLALVPAVAALLAMATTVSADSWPSKPVRVIVPIGAGSAIDIVPRTVLEEVSRQIGQPIVVENRPGAGTMIGTAAVVKSDPDGYMLLSTSAALTIAQVTSQHSVFDAARDFAGVGVYGVMPNVLVVSPTKGIRTVQELVAKAKADPDSLSYASAGAGTPSHFNTLRFLASADINAQHIPFKGAPDALTEIITGRVSFYFVPLLPALPFIQDGKLVPLAVSSSKRTALLPDVPTTTEAGFSNSAYDFWIGMVAHAKTDRSIIDRLHHEIKAALDKPAVREKLSSYGVDPIALTTSEFDALIKEELVANAELAASIAAKPAQ